MFDIEHVLLVNTPYSYLHSFSATGVSSGLAIRVEVGRVLYGAEMLVISFLYRSRLRDFLGCVLNGCVSV
jgi:hypothetical protein